MNTRSRRIGLFRPAMRQRLSNPRQTCKCLTVRIAILGSGFVATGYKLYLESIGHEPLVVSRSFCYYPHVAVIRSLLEHYRPHVVINAAGFTGLTVDCCEVKKGDCLAANVTLPVDVARECYKLSIPFIQISSGCIFDGPGPFTEESEPNPVSFYTRCKLLAEINLAQFKPWTFRIRMPFSTRNHPRNLLVKLAKYEKILDGANSMTWLEEFCERSWQIFEKGSPPQSPAIFHAVQPGAVRTLDIAQLLLDAHIRSLPVSVFDPSEFYQDGSHVKRSEAVLSSEKFDSAFGSRGTQALLAVRRCIEKLVEGKNAG